MDNHYDVAINGAGLVGASLAIGLARAGFRVVLFERTALSNLYPQTDYGLRVSAFTPSSKKWFNHVRVWDALMHTGRVTPFSSMYVWDKGGKGALRFNPEGLASDALGWIIDNEAAQGALLDQVQSCQQIRVLENTSLTHFEMQANSVRLFTAQNEAYEAKLVVGADGGHSMIRDWAGIPCLGWSYGQKTIVGQVRPERSHENTCWQRFMPTGPIALLPLSDGRCSLAWHTTCQDADQLLELASSEMEERLTQAFEGRFGSIRLAGELGAYPLRLNHARVYTRERFVLVGDAAHNIHPLAGLGVNIGFLDAATLVDELIKTGPAGLLSDLTSLKYYERRRKMHNVAVMTAMDLIKRISETDQMAIPWMRNLGLSLTDRLPFIKKQLVKSAMGYYSSVPSWMKP